MSVSPRAASIVPGGLLSMFRLGVLIIGDSGVGKSESALELIARGHRFVTDDVVQVRRAPGGKLIGRAPSISRHFMEIRGLGIINIRQIFGAKSIAPESPIDLVIRLKKWQRKKEFDRLGLRFPEDTPIAGVRVPQMNIPVAPGRNIATLIEVACKVHLLKCRGYDAALDLSTKLDRALARGGPRGKP
jgi:HPr kinase/phosphorylase